VSCPRGREWVLLSAVVAAAIHAFWFLQGTLSQVSHGGHRLQTGCTDVNSTGASCMEHRRCCGSAAAAATFSLHDASMSIFNSLIGVCNH
jgi:hypothetical protein